jgi:hypothetical protein
MSKLCSLLLLTPALVAQAPSPQADAFGPVRFLEGEWTGEGDGQPGAAAGRACFRFELEGRVMVRRNRADLAASKGRPAARHEDLMTLFVEGGQLKAIYFDNEAHVIRYQVTPLQEGVAFTSEPGPGPRFRLSYLKKAETLVTVRFEIASPGKPEAFSTYLEGVTRKVK